MFNELLQPTWYKTTNMSTLRYSSKIKQVVCETIIVKQSAHYEKTGKRAQGIVKEVIAKDFPSLGLKYETVRSWLQEYKSAVKNDTVPLESKSNRSYMTLPEKHVLNRVLTWSLQDNVFPNKYELETIAQDVCMGNDRRAQISRWEYLRKIIRDEPLSLSYKKIHSRSSGQVLTIDKVEEINEFWTLLHTKYLNNKDYVEDVRIWVMDESSFRNGDFSKKGWAKRGGENQQIVSNNNTKHTDTLVGTVSSHGDVFSYYIPHQQLQCTLPDHDTIFLNIKGMNTPILMQYV